MIHVGLIDGLIALALDFEGLKNSHGPQQKHTNISLQHFPRLR
jgi:hypothetical protein